MCFIILLSFSTDVPGLAATLRCVPDEQRSFAVSLQWIVARCLGTIPGPILFGRVIDETCIFWKESCDDEQGACYYYDNEEMSNYFLALSLCCKVVVIIMFVLSLVLYKPPPATDAKDVVVVATDNDAKSGVRNPSFKELEHDADNERKNGHTAAVGT